VRFTREGCGRVELVDADTFLAEAPAVYDRHRARWPAEIERDAFVWEMDARGFPSEPYKGFYALCRDERGVTTGFVRYTIDKRFDQRRPDCRVEVAELIGDPGAELALWRYVTGIDWATRVVAENRSVDERLPYWVTDGRHVRLTERADLVWARPLDVAACLRARTYAAPVDAVIEVVDPVGLSGGRWRLRVDGGAHGGASCEPTTETPDVTLPVATLGAVLLGGTALATLAAAGLADEHRPGALRAANAAFRGDVTPWSTTWF
jgi:predicted acetyltransferase